MLTESQVQQFKDKLTESIFVTPQDAEYANFIKRWNDVGERRAGGIVLAGSERDVCMAITLAVDFSLDLAIRGGGHSHFAASSTEGGIVIDLRNMNKVTVNDGVKTVTVEGGALWSDVDEALGAKGLAAVGGTVNHTGVGGLTLGGGYGWLSGQYGLALDNLLSARIALQDGRIVEASATSHTDLFWAIRGGGGNFGVAVEFVFQAYEKQDEVFASDSHPTEDTDPAIAVVPFYDGPEDAARKRFEKLLSINPIANGTSMLPYAKVNSLLLDGAKHGGRKFQAGAVWEPPLLLEQLDEVIGEYCAMLEAYPETAGSAVLFQFDHPAKIASIPINATAFANRGYHRLAMVEVKFKNAALDAVALKCAKKIIRTLEGWDRASENGAGVKVYSNYATGDENAREIFGTNLERLTEVKRAYDPGNIFNKWFPIRP